MTKMTTSQQKSLMSKLSIEVRLLNKLSQSTIHEESSNGGGDRAAGAGLLRSALRPVREKADQPASQHPIRPVRSGFTPSSRGRPYQLRDTGDWTTTGTAAAPPHETRPRRVPWGVHEAPLLSERVHCLVLVGRRPLAVVLPIAGSEGESAYPREALIHHSEVNVWSPHGHRNVYLVTARHLATPWPASQLIRHSRPFEPPPPLRSLGKGRIAPPPPPLVAGLVLGGLGDLEQEGKGITNIIRLAGSLAAAIVQDQWTWMIVARQDESAGCFLTLFTCCLVYSHSLLP